MMLVAGPFMGIVVVALAIMLVNDVRRARRDRRRGVGIWADDEISDLPEDLIEPGDLLPAPLDDV